MRIGIPKEEGIEQTRVAATPDTTKKLIELGYAVCVEQSAGMLANFTDEMYKQAGASIESADFVWDSDIVICLDSPTVSQLNLMHDGACLIGCLNPAINDNKLQEYSKKRLTAISMDSVPRISRAQSIDVRSSMTNLSGYRAVIEAAWALGRSFGGQMTAAGKIDPSRVYVIGVGVAGLSAIGTASSMGANVYATDVRPEVADQVESLGATFVEIPVKQQSEDGYARALTDDETQQANKVYAQQAAKSDVVITTAMVAGSTPPLLLDEDAISKMKPGSVIVDLGACPNGGNTSLTKYNDVITTPNGVTIIGHANLPSRLGAQASQLYGQNIVNFFKLVTPNKNGELVLDEEDDVVRAMTVALQGEIMWPPPPVKVSAAQAADINEMSNTPCAAQPSAQGEIVEKSPTETAQNNYKRDKILIKIALAIAVALIMTLIYFAPEDMKPHFMVLMLSIVVGFYVINGVSHSLHTPLMSVTNAISGIIVVGAILAITTPNPFAIALASIAIVLASINIFGGFCVTSRMLKMFARSTSSVSDTNFDNCPNSKGDK